MGIRLISKEADRQNEDDILISLTDFGNVYLVSCSYSLGDVFYDWSFFTAVLFREKGVVLDARVKDACIDSKSRKEIVEMLGCSPKTLHKVFRCIVGELLIDDLQPYAAKLCLKRVCIRTRRSKKGYKTEWRWDFPYLFKLKACLDKIKQLDADGLMHLAPLVQHHNKTLKELKEFFGASIWKKLCKNSLTRNKLIVSYVRRRQYLNNFKDLHLIPSTILKDRDLIIRFASSIIYKVCVIYKNSKLYYKDMGREHIQYYSDMQIMAYTLGHNPKPKTWDDVIKLHDRYTKEQVEKGAATKSKEPITYVIDPFIIGEYRCTPLLSDHDLYFEGKTMKHCIYTYRDRVLEKCYYVIHIENTKTGERSTLGIDINSNRIDVNQHYGVCNSHTKNKEIVDDVLKHIKPILEEKINANSNYNNLSSSLNRAS